MSTVPESSLLTIFADETHMLPAQICADVEAIAASGKGCPVLLASLLDSLECLCRAMEGMLKAGYGADRPARSHGAPVSRTGVNPNCLI